jgi:uncharacterized protein (TIGR02594 family)
MVALTAYRRSLVALVFCSAAIAVSTSPASARSHHGAGRHAHARQVTHHVTHRVAHHARMHARHHHVRYATRDSHWDRAVAEMHARGFENTQASVMSGAASNAAALSGGFGSSNLVTEARRYLGGNPTSRRSLWCARFMNMVLEHTGHRGTGSDMANSFAGYGQRIAGPQVGAIAVMSRRGGGHVGIITGIDARGNPIMISGNNGNRVREAPVSRGRIYAYVMPSS